MLTIILSGDLNVDNSTIETGFGDGSQADAGTQATKIYQPGLESCNFCCVGDASERPCDLETYYSPPKREPQ